MALLIAVIGVGMVLDGYIAQRLALDAKVRVSIPSIYSYQQMMMMMMMMIGRKRRIDRHGSACLLPLWGWW